VLFKTSLFNKLYYILTYLTYTIQANISRPIKRKKCAGARQNRPPAT